MAKRIDNSEFGSFGDGTDRPVRIGYPLGAGFICERSLGDKQNCQHKAEDHYDDGPCAACECIGWQPRKVVYSPIRPGKWYREHSMADLMMEHGLRGIPMPNLHGSRDAVGDLADSLNADDMRRRAGVVAPAPLRGCCYTPLGESHAPQCTVPTDRIPEQESAATKEWVFGPASVVELDKAEEFARKHHEIVKPILQSVANYAVWEWDDIPDANRNALIQAAREMLQ